MLLVNICLDIYRNFLLQSIKEIKCYYIVDLLRRIPFNESWPFHHSVLFQAIDY